MTRRFWPLALGAAILFAAPALSAPDAQRLAPPGASSCSGCHALRPAQGDAVPPITGRPVSELVEAMGAFRAGERPATIMTRIARGFSPEETRALAEWLETVR